MGKEKVNAYRRSGELLFCGHEAMEKLYQPKVVICKQIIGLSAGTIARAFNVVGKAYIEGIRQAMIEELEGMSTPACSWRDVATRLKSREAVFGLE